MRTSPASERIRLDLDTDVLVAGGGPAGTWAALAARRAGARVVLVDKGYCGASGVGAAAGMTHWLVPPERREDAIAARLAFGGGLAERAAMAPTLDAVWRAWPEVADAVGYPATPFMERVLGPQRLVQGPVYLREMRRRVVASGVRIIDHAPALELLTDPDGAVVGAAGVLRQRDRAWRVVAGAVVLATGGCAFRSNALGSHVVTGDGLLMAAEVGAELSGMEFSNYYGLVPVGTAMDENAYLGTATFFDGNGHEVGRGRDELLAVHTGQEALMRAALGGPLFATLDRAPDDVRTELRAHTVNLFMVFDRLGIDPFRERFEVEFVLEGTVRGSGGVRTVDLGCGTGVPGLWVAGDTASREPLVGAASGAGAPNSAWTIASGLWSGSNAARFALAAPRHPDATVGAGRVGLRPGAHHTPGLAAEVVAGTQTEILPLDKNAFRTGGGLRDSLARLDELWLNAAERLGGTSARDALRAREATALLAAGRWSYRSALARTETRGMHRRDDHPHPDPNQRHRLVVTGVDTPRVTPTPVVD